MKFEIWIAFLAATTLMSLFPGAGAVAPMGNSLSHGARKSKLIEMPDFAGLHPACRLLNVLREAPP